MRTETDGSGITYYYNDRDQLHRENGPAIEYRNKAGEYWVNGRHYYEVDYKELSFKKEELDYYDGARTTWRDWQGQLHRYDGPAVIYHSNRDYKDNPPTFHWFVHGVKHRLDGPATMWNDGKKVYVHHGSSITLETQQERLAEWGQKTLALIEECIDIFISLA